MTRPPIARPHARTHTWRQRPGTLQRTGTGRRRRRTGQRRRNCPRRRRQRTPWGNSKGAAGARHTSHHRSHGHGRCGCRGARLRRLPPAAGRRERRRSAWANAHEAPPLPLCMRRGHGHGGPPNLARGCAGADEGRLPLHPQLVPLGGERGVPVAILWRRGHDACLRRHLHFRPWGQVHEPGGRPGGRHRLPRRRPFLLVHTTRQEIEETEGMITALDGTDVRQEEVISAT